MANDRLFIVKNGAGEQFEPADQATLEKWAEQGKIDLDCKIRSTMVANWSPAIEMPFLKPMLKKQLATKVEKQHDNWKTRLKARIFLRATIFESANGLVKSDETNNPRAELWVRIAAALTDLLIMGAWAVIIFLACAWLFSKGKLNQDNAFYTGFTFFWITGLFYYVFSITLNTQTPGQKFWGIFLVRTNGEEFWYGRVFFYIMLLIPFGIFSPFFIMGSASQRSLQEILTKTKMVRIVFDPGRRKRKR